MCFAIKHIAQTQLMQFFISTVCCLKAPLGLSLLRNRDILISEENKKSEPFSYREKVRILLLWCDREDSNLWPSGSEPNALSS